MKTLSATLALTAGLALTSLAHAQGGQCFRPHDIQGFTTANDNRTVYVRAGGRVFQLVTANVCPELAQREHIQLNAEGSSSTICNPIEANLRVRTAGISISCPVDTLRVLSPDEVRALPKKLRP